MNKLFTCAALLLATACARVEPVDDDALSEVEDLPTPAELANQVDDQRRGGTPGLRFAWRDDGDGVVWGPEGRPAGAAPRLAIACDTSGPQPQLVMTHYGEGNRESGVSTLRISGNGASASLPVALSTDDQAERWLANVGPGDLMDSLDDTFGSIGLVNVSLSGAQTLQVDSTDTVRGIFDRCGANASTAAVNEDAAMTNSMDDAS